MTFVWKSKSVFFSHSCPKTLCGLKQDFIWSPRPQLSPSSIIIIVCALSFVHYTSDTTIIIAYWCARNKSNKPKGNAFF